MAKILGIDLGTTNSAMAVTEGGAPKIIENKEMKSEFLSAFLNENAMKKGKIYRIY